MTEASQPPPAVPAQAPVPPHPGTVTAPVAPAVARRPGLDPATRRQTGIVAVVLAAMYFGSQLLNAALPGAAATDIQVQPGNPVQIGDGWQITPGDGWVASRHDSGNGIRLEKGVVVIDLFADSFDSATDLANAYLEQSLKAGATQITASDVETASAAGGSAARFTYQGLFPEASVAIEGEVTAIVTGGTGVIADAWSPQGDLGQLLGEIHQMLDTIAVAA